METTIVIKATAERAPVEAGVTITTDTCVATSQVKSASKGSAPAQTQKAKKENPVFAPVAPASVKFGLDVHAAQITACRQLDGSLPQPAHRRSAAEVLALVAEHRARGAQVYTCYEAGPCGYGLHRSLEALGAVNYVVAPQRWDLSGRRVKTDKRDARELCLRLDQYVRGNTAAFTVVRVPTAAQEQRRALCRQRGAVLKERQRCELRGHGLALAQGVRAPAGWWEPAAWAEFAPALPDWLRPLLERWQRHALRLQDELDALTARVEALSAELLVPKGLGALTAAVLDSEILDWTRFTNRRQPGSYTGLCPGESSSGERRRQGAVSKHGNPRVRHLLVEAVWRMLQWQPDYRPFYAVRAATNSRARKRAAVAAARRLAVDLWRINTGRVAAEKLGLVMVRL
jgi:transposase